jgi:hypothetical protein
MASAQLTACAELSNGSRACANAIFQEKTTNCRAEIDDNCQKNVNQFTIDPPTKIIMALEDAIIGRLNKLIGDAQQLSRGDAWAQRATGR